MIIKLSVKVSDRGSYAFINDAGTELYQHDGYVPNFFPGRHFGDYLELDIDVKTGKIVNWKANRTMVMEELRRLSNENKGE